MASGARSWHGHPARGLVSGHMGKTPMPLAPPTIRRCGAPPNVCVGACCRRFFREQARSCKLRPCPTFRHQGRPGGLHRPAAGGAVSGDADSAAARGCVSRCWWRWCFRRSAPTRGSIPSRRGFGPWPRTPEAMSRVPVAEVEAIIRPCGLARAEGAGDRRAVPAARRTARRAGAAQLLRNSRRCRASGTRPRRWS